MSKKGVSLSFNTIIIAIIALVVLIVIIAIYVGFIGKSTGDIKKPADEAGKNANVAAWCMSAYISGAGCEVEGCSGGDCTPATKSDNEYKCEGEYGKKRIHKKTENGQEITDLCCCK